LADADLAGVRPEKTLIGGEAHARQQFADASQALAPAFCAVRAPDLAQLRLDAQRRVQRQHRALQHQGHLSAPHAAQFAAAQPHDVAAVEVDGAPNSRAAELQQP
jgi:hypothetical protein